MTFIEHNLFNTLPSDKGNELLFVVEKHFKNKKLTFCLLELVLLAEKGIGETYVFARKDYDANALHEQYYELVQKFKSEFDGGVPAYTEWYQQSTWICFGTGVECKEKYSSKEYGWIGKFDPRDQKKYGEKSGLTKEIIQNYFNKYEQEIGKLVLANHPYYSIVIHPIGRPKKEVIVPYGNLYLHFATIEEIRPNLIEKFLDEFMSVWYKYYGGFNHDKILDQLVSSIFESADVQYFFPNDLGTHTDKMKYAFTQYFCKNENFEKIRKRVILFKTKLQIILTKQDGIDIDPEIRDFKTAPKYDKLYSDYNERHFENFILKRSLALFLFFNKKFSIKRIEELLMKKIQTGKTKSHLAYFYQHLHIYFPEKFETEDQSPLRDKIRAAIIAEAQHLHTPEELFISDASLIPRDKVSLAKFISSLSPFEKSIITEFAFL